MTPSSASIVQIMPATGDWLAVYAEPSSDSSATLDTETILGWGVVRHEDCERPGRIIQRVVGLTNMDDYGLTPADGQWNGEDHPFISYSNGTDLEKLRARAVKHFELMETKRQPKHCP